MGCQELRLERNSTGKEACIAVLSYLSTVTDTSAKAQRVCEGFQLQGQSTVMGEVRQEKQGAERRHERLKSLTLTAHLQ